MSAQSSQVQLKISLSHHLYDLLLSKANSFGIPVTQYVKYLIIKAVENENPSKRKISEKKQTK